MKMLPWMFYGLTLVTNCLGAPFINLDFEAIDTNAIPGYPFPRSSITRAVAVPGWILFGDTNTSSGINFNSDCDEFCGAIVTREAFDPHNGSLVARSYFPKGLHGNFGLGLAPKPDFPVSISQRGDVPSDAKYLYLDVQLSTFALFGIWIDGEQQHSYDISAFAGKNINLELRFGAFQQSPGPTMPPATVGLDAVVFLVPPKLETASSLGTNGFTLSWTNDVSTRYQVEYTTNFPAKWQPLGATVSSTNGNFIFTDTNATKQATAQRFYRLRLAP